MKKAVRKKKRRKRRKGSECSNCKMDEETDCWCGDVIGVCDFCGIDVKEKWDYGVLPSGKVICRPCDKKGLGDSEDEA